MPAATIPVLEGSLRSVAKQLSQLQRGPKTDWGNEENWKNLDENTMAHNAENFLISCGTITLRDGFRTKQGPPEVLVNLNPKLSNAYMLPKGRKDIHNDSLWKTAHRETEEETSITPRPLYLKSSTRFTVPDDKDVGKNKTLVPLNPVIPEDQVQKDDDKNEIIGKDIIFSYSELDLKYGVRYVFLYPAHSSNEIDLTKLAKKDKGKGVEWLPIDEAIRKLGMHVEREAVKRMKTLLEGMTDGDWKISDALSGQEA